MLENICVYLHLFLLSEFCAFSTIEQSWILAMWRIRTPIRILTMIAWLSLSGMLWWSMPTQQSMAASTGSVLALNTTARMRSGLARPDLQPLWTISWVHLLSFLKSNGVFDVVWIRVMYKRFFSCWTSLQNSLILLNNSESFCLQSLYSGRKPSSTCLLLAGDVVNRKFIVLGC